MKTIHLETANARQATRNLDSLVANISATPEVIQLLDHWTTYIRERLASIDDKSAALQEVFVLMGHKKD